MVGRAVILLTTGRARSSLVAKLLSEQGIWTGETREGDRFNPEGYFENTEIKKRLIKCFGKDWAKGPFPEPQDGWTGEVMRALYSQGYSGGPWLFKGGAFYWKVWQPFDPLYVKIWRAPQDILASYRRCRFLGRDMERIVMRQLDEMQSIPGPSVDTDRDLAPQIEAVMHAID